MEFAATSRAVPCLVDPATSTRHSVTALFFATCSATNNVAPVHQQRCMAPRRTMLNRCGQALIRLHIAYIEGPSKGHAIIVAVTRPIIHIRTVARSRRNAALSSTASFQHCASQRCTVHRCAALVCLLHSNAAL